MADPVVLEGVLDYRRIGDPTSPPIGFFDARGMTDEVPRATLFDDARAAAAGLAHHGIKAGDRVIIAAPTSRDYLTVLLACLLSRVAPCTVAPPNNPDSPTSAGVRHLHAAVAAVRPAAVLAADARLAAAAPAGTPALTFSDLRGHGTIPADGGEPADPQTVHHIQLTSGSTSAPKAVVLTHGNVSANLGALAAATELLAGRDRIFTWLPLYHDMGLVQVLLAFTRGVALDLMPPIGFLRDPLAWLRHISDRGATHTAAPPFAYRAAADRQARRPDPRLNLSTLRQAYVGAEPIPVATLRLFRDTFAPHGLADETLIPCYGMAETVLATTLALDPAPAGEHSFGRVRWRQFDRASLDERQVAVPPIPGRPTRSIVCCGTTIPGLTLRITDESGREVPEGHVGAIEVRGTSVMAGYLTPEDGGVTAPRDGWHHTGDLGLRHNGELYVVGRTKEMLIVNGRNLPPYDVESVIEEHPHVASGGAAVFSYPSEDKGTEPVVAVVETRAATAEWPTIRTEITTAVREVFGLSLADVVIVPRGGIPRTSSGKRQRAALRNTYLADKQPG